MAISKGTFVAYAGADPSAGTVDSSSFDSTGINLLVVATGWEDVNATPTFSDNKSNTWQTAVVENGGGGAGTHIAVNWSVLTNVGSGHAVTITYGTNVPFRRVCVLPVIGNFAAVDAIAATTQQAQATTTGSIPPDSNADAGSLVTSAAAILIQAVIDYNGETSVQGTGWTKDSATTGRHFQSRIEAAGGTFDPVMDLQTGGVQYSTIAMAFKETSGGAAAYNAVPLQDHYYRMISG
jgi:hypothetical protein